MAAAGIQLSEDSERAFTQALDYLSKHTNWGAETILKNAAVSYVRAARNATPKARKGAKRKVIKGPRYQETSTRGNKDSSGRWSVLVLSQRGAPKPVPVWEQDRPARTVADIKRLPIAQVKHVGAAKGSWWGVLRDLNKPAADRGPDVGAADFSNSATEPAVTLTNRLSYLLKIAPSVDREAKRRAAQDIVKKTDNIIQKRWERGQ